MDWANQMNELYLIFTRDAFDDVLDYVQEKFIGIPDRSTIDRSEWFFAYDVTSTHLRRYHRHRGRLQNMVWLNNDEGPRNALYPDVMQFIVDHENIRLTESDYMDDMEGSLGVICYSRLPSQMDRVYYLYFTAIHMVRLLDMLDTNQLDHVECLSINLRWDPNIDRFTTTYSIRSNVMKNLYIRVDMGLNIRLDFRLRIPYLEYLRVESREGMEVYVSGVDWSPNIRYLDETLDTPIRRYINFPNQRLLHYGSNIYFDLLTLLTHFPSLTSIRLSESYNESDETRHAMNRLSIVEIPRLDGDILDDIIVNLPLLRVLHIDKLDRPIYPGSQCRLLSLTTRRFDPSSLLSFPNMNTMMLSRYMPRLLNVLPDIPDDVSIGIDGVPIDLHTIETLLELGVYIHLTDRGLDDRSLNYTDILKSPQVRSRRLLFNTILRFYEEYLIDISK